MSIIDKALEANSNYAKSYNPTLGKPPAPKIAVVTCMDPRLSDLSGILGLPQADIDVIRTGGPAVTEDVLGELIVSNRVLGTTEILLLNHTGCGFTTFTDDEMNAKLRAVTASRSIAAASMWYQRTREPPQPHLRRSRAGFPAARDRGTSELPRNSPRKSTLANPALFGSREKQLLRLLKLLGPQGLVGLM